MNKYLARFKAKKFFNRLNAASFPAKTTLLIVPVLDEYLMDYRRPDSILGVKFYVLVHLEQEHWMLLGQADGKGPRTFGTIDAVFNYFTFLPGDRDEYKGQFGIANINQRLYGDTLNQIGRLAGYEKGPLLRSLGREGLGVLAGWYAPPPGFVARTDQAKPSVEQ